VVGRGVLSQASRGAGHRTRRVLLDRATFQDWLWEKHGSVGRLLLAPVNGSWWVINDADLEVIVCGRAGVVRIGLSDAERPEFDSA
jgi:hypothetical protein